MIRVGSVKINNKFEMLLLIILFIVIFGLFLCMDWNVIVSFGVDVLNVMMIRLIKSFERFSCCVIWIVLCIMVFLFVVNKMRLFKIRMIGIYCVFFVMILFLIGWMSWVDGVYL